MDFVIIGGDAAGMSAASKARRLKPELNISVFEKTLDVSYSACGMPYNIAEPERDIDDLVVRQAKVFREKHKINLLTGRMVTDIDLKNQNLRVVTLTGKTSSFNYDKLLIATGGSPIIPDLPGFRRAGVLPLKSLEDGRKIKAYLHEKKVKHVIIIGMGYIGLEMCEALRVRDIAVSMVKPGPALFPWMAPQLAEVVRDTLLDNHVALYPGRKIKGIEQFGKGLKLLAQDGDLEADMILPAVGVVPNSELAAGAGLELSVNNSISTDETLKTSNHNIYAAGDCADAFHLVTGKKTWIPLALRANRAGWAAADNVCGKNVKLSGVAGTAVFKVFDLQVARTGLNQQEAQAAGFDPAAVTITSRSRAHAHPGATPIYVHLVGDKKSGRLLGAQMVGKEGAAHRINAAAVALHAQLTVEDFFQCDMAYAPPFGPVWDPLLTAANQLLREL